MKSTFFNLLVAASAILFLQTGCKGDDDGGTDQTSQVVGTYVGTYEETSEGLSVSTDDTQTIVTKESGSQIKVNIAVIPGLASVVFKADMTDETHFTVPKFTLFEDELEGSGSLNGNVLSIDLEAVSGDVGDGITYDGTKQ